jgi:two-component system cell cycle sensor histidine kinase/response regulator CckA
MSRTILLIEDEEAQRELVKRVLETRGYELTDAANGQEGIRKLSAGDYDAILLDLRMPQGSGEIVIQWIIANRPELRPRILVMTGDLLSPGLEAFLERVQVPMLPKPYMLADLVQAVAKIAPPDPPERVEPGAKKKQGIANH